MKFLHFKIKKFLEVLTGSRLPMLKNHQIPGLEKKMWVSVTAPYP